MWPAFILTAIFATGWNLCYVTFGELLIGAIVSFHFVLYGTVD